MDYYTYLLLGLLATGNYLLPPTTTYYDLLTTYYHLLLLQLLPIVYYYQYLLLHDLNPLPPQATYYHGAGYQAAAGLST